MDSSARHSRVSIQDSLSLRRRVSWIEVSILPREPTQSGTLEASTGSGIGYVAEPRSKASARSGSTAFGTPVPCPPGCSRSTSMRTYTVGKNRTCALRLSASPHGPSLLPGERAIP